MIMRVENGTWQQQKQLSLLSRGAPARDVLLPMYKYGRALPDRAVAAH